MNEKWKIPVFTGRMNTGAMNLVYLVDNLEADLIEKIPGNIPEILDKESKLTRLDYGRRYDICDTVRNKDYFGYYVRFVNGKFSFAESAVGEWHTVENTKGFYLKPSKKFI